MDLDSLNNTNWDVVIAGTGLSESLLALSLSRSGEKILHVDRHGFYGGSEAALSLQEAEEWVKSTETSRIFRDASTSKTDEQSTVKLAFPRAYSLGLAPQLIYTDSPLLKVLVSSKVYRQLEFLAIGAWWLYQKSSGASDSGRLLRVPTSREDVAFADSSIDMRSRRAVMKILRFVIDYENQTEIWEPFSSRPFVEFLAEHFKIRLEQQSMLLDLFLGLTLSILPNDSITTKFALERIARHVRSIGRLGPGFNAVVPKWGGLAEVTQVACRAGAVGGAIYVLGTGVQEILDDDKEISLRLTNGDVVRTKHLVGGQDDIPATDGKSSEPIETVCRSVSVVSGALQSILPPVSENVKAAGTVVVFPFASLREDSPAVYLTVHATETGECPSGQSVIYATSTSQDAADTATKKLLESLPDQSEREGHQVLFTLRYTQSRVSDTLSSHDRLITFPAPSLDMAVDETVLDQVKTVWKEIAGDDGEFLIFPDREGEMFDDDDEEAGL